MNLLYILVLTFTIQNPLTGTVIGVQSQEVRLVEDRYDAKKLIRECESFDYKKPYKKCEAKLYEVDLKNETIREDKRMVIY